MRKMFLLFFILIFNPINMVAGVKTKTNKDYSLSYRIKKLFGPSSEERLAKMTQQEKNGELQFYCEKEATPPYRFPFGREWMPAIFQPNQKYFNEIIYLIEHGASVNIDIPYSWFLKVGGQGIFKPIYLFIKANDLENTRRLLEYGAKVDKPILRKRVNQEPCDWNLLHPLFLAHTKEMAELLLQHGAQLQVNGEFNKGGSYATGTLLEAMVNENYEADLIPLYFSLIDEFVVKDIAQKMLDDLIPLESRYNYFKKNERFYLKKIYLEQAGAVSN